MGSPMRGRQRPPASTFCPLDSPSTTRASSWWWGAGTGMVLRFDRAGNPLNSLRFADARLACLGLGALDGPALALDSKQNVYVVYNVLKKGTTPEAFWAKFDAAGSLIWNRPLEGLFARHVAVDESDHIFVESLGQIRHYDENGKLLFQGLLPPLMVSRMQLWDGKFAVLVHSFEENYQMRLQVYEDPVRSPAESTLTHELPVQVAADFSMEHAHSRIFVVNSHADRIEVFRDGQHTPGGDPAAKARVSSRFRARPPLSIILSRAGCWRERLSPVVSRGTHPVRSTSPTPSTTAFRNSGHDLLPSLLRR